MSETTITAVGVGEAFDSDFGNSSMLVEAEGFALLIDCGFSAVSLLWAQRPDVDAIDAIYFTHHHPDHVLGVVPLLDRWNSKGRRAPVTLLSTPEGLDHLRRLFATTYVPVDARSPFPVHFAVAAEQAEIGPFRMMVASTAHSIANHAVRLERAGRRFAYSGDGRPTAASRALYAEADLLLHECYSIASLPETASHCDLATARAISGPGRVGLYHVERGSRDPLTRAIAGDDRLFVVEPGAKLSL